MLKHFTAALAALFFLFPLSAVGESLDLSQLGAIEEAEHLSLIHISEPTRP